MFSIPREKYTIYTYRIKHIGVGEGGGRGGGTCPKKFRKIFFGQIANMRAF